MYLYDGRIERVEVEEQYESIVVPLLRLQDQPSRVSILLLVLPLALLNRLLSRTSLIRHYEVQIYF